MQNIEYRGLGRRKSSTVRVILKKGTGQITINKSSLKDYFKSDSLIKDVLRPIEITETQDNFDILVNAKGGGLSGQAGSTRLAIARALLKVSPDYRIVLKQAKMLTRNSRVVERKKPGLRKARRARQFSKR